LTPQRAGYDVRVRSPRRQTTPSIWRYVAPVALIALAVLFYRIVWDGLQDRPAELPAAVAAEVAETTAAAPEVPANVPKRYRIRKNDTLSSIAERYGITVDGILALNPGLDPLALEPGARIVLRGG